MLDKAGNLIGGYTAYLLARKYGLEHVPVRYGQRQIITAAHRPGGKLYSWELPRILVDQVKAGDWVRVRTEKGCTTVKVAEVEEYAGQEPEPLRVGELTGLRWSDVDLKENVIHIRQQEVEGISDFVFTNSQGRPYATNAVNSMLKSIVEAYNKLESKKAEKESRIPEPFPHISARILRHTACARLAESGLEPKVLRYIMGHANISVTMDIYTHLDFSRIQRRMEEVREYIKIG